MSDKPSKAQDELKDKILAERAKGNLVYARIEGYSVVSVDDFVKQPVDGMLYDLNRGEEVSLSFITEKKWVNDFAVALVIRKLVEQRDNALRAEAQTPKWRDPKDKPPNVPGEAHSESVLLYMKTRGWVDECPIKIGHVSCGHWRPSGGNGNFDDDVAGWLPLPSGPSTP